MEFLKTNLVQSDLGYQTKQILLVKIECVTRIKHFPYSTAYGSMPQRKFEDIKGK